MFNMLEDQRMKRGFAFKTWVYLLCVSFLLLANGFHTMVVEAKRVSRPLGEMISRGDVKFESRKAVWKPVEPSQFPIFEAVRIKTEKGASLITLENNSQIDVGENSLFSFDRIDQMHLTQGAIDFRLPPTPELSFKAGNLTVTPSKSFRASKSPSAVSPKSEAILGSIAVHSNGAITVKSLQGSLSVLNQERVVLASLSSKEAITLPSVMVNGPSNVMVAQASDKTRDPADSSSQFLGVSIWIWTATISVVAIAAIAVVAAATYHHGGGAAVPVCP
jgi:hypothetical protein